MAREPQAWLDHQRKRWMRPDAHRYICPDMHRWQAPAYPERKFDPDQPRVPAGSPDGGQWSGADLSGDEDSTSITLAAMSKNARCEAQWLTDTLLCRMARNSACWAQAMVRLVACERGTSIPPLNY